MFKTILAVLACLFISSTAIAETYIPEEGSDELLKKRKVKIPYDKNLPDVLIIGDSISIGYTPFVAQLLKGKANVIHHKGNSQGTTNGLLKLSSWLGDKKWAVIHFNFGLHDLKHVTEAGTSKNSNSFDDPQQADLPTYTKNLAVITEKLKKTGSQLIFATTTPYPAGVKPARLPADAVKYNENAIKIMKKNDVAVNDLYNHILPHLKKLQRPVNVHFSPEGSLHLARKVAKGILEKLPKK